ncbi:hypothetical protein N7456_007200 [Penicillium angulare]|uniref:Zn(2)-C6 fungal-type domain-containing protein n=1 Tax=Penicillium angulare TaxID=116970 RepID=A0A9W9FJ97_9EURO|nr:hypothetical protein N7456_007200 [Penicillium angulare]
MKGSKAKNSLNDSESAGDEQQETLHPSKRAKRSKYASKACGQCKKRKIKCDGNSPCRTCADRGHDCQRTGTDMRGKWRSLDSAKSSPADLASRLSRVEDQLSTMKNPEQHSQHSNCQASEPDASHSPERRVPNAEHSTGSSKVPAFSGETSITHNLTVVENRLEQMGVQYERCRSASPSYQFDSRLTPSPDSPPGHSKQIQTCIYRRSLNVNGIVPDRKQWDGLLTTFCDEVHILVPFLHLPSVWKLYGEIWETSFSGQSRKQDQSGLRRVQTAYVLLCLANGRCVESSRFEDGEGQYSAGWSLYNAARDIFGDLLNGFRLCTDQILILQTCLLMVVYLFRLDAHGSAEKVLALTISHAHHLGLQRNRVVNSMSPFESEISRRLWWCLYLLDRRLAIETGRPFLIQDVNVDVELPHDLSDEWLTISKERLQHSSMVEIETEPRVTSVPYLIAMTSYSRVIGKVWEALYGAATSESTPSPLLNEYLEHLITQSQRGIKQEFTYDPHNPVGMQARGLEWWQVKQRFIMRIRWSSLYLLVRKPMLQKPCPPHQVAPDVIENEIICMRLTQSIFDDFNSMPEQHPKYTFPFLHYLTSATIIALGLIIKQPSFKRVYGNLTLRAARSLWDHCRKTWVSGKMAQTVWKLNQMADATIKSAKDRSQNSNESSERHSEPFLSGMGANSPLTRNPRPGATSRDRRIAVANNQQEHSGRGPSSSSEPDIHAGNFINGPDAYPLQRNHNNEHDPTEFGYHRKDGVAENNFNPAVDLEILQPQPRLSDTRQEMETELYTEISFPGEMIDGGMEWLQTLFVSGLDANLPPVWD